MTDAAGPLTPALRVFGDTALLVEAPADLSARDALREVIAIRERLGRARIAGVIDLVPAARTVLVRWDPRATPPSVARVRVARALAGGPSDAEDAPSPAESEAPVEIGIRYDGPDLEETATLLGIRADDLVARHLAATWTVAFTGFAPGFGYLVSDDWLYEVPRLAEPRTRVPPGAVGLAAGFTGAYPRATPGGWRLIGSTPAPLFDPDAASPALLRPGATVRFRRLPLLAASSQAAVSPDRAGSLPPRQAETPRSHRSVADAGAGPSGARGGGPGIRIARPGLLATIQDAGRPGAGSLGVSVSGALDRAAWRTGNRLVGNDESAAAVEIAAGGFEAIARIDLWFAVTGAWGPLTLDGVPLDHAVPHAWHAGQRLVVGWFTAGVRAYLAIRGGVHARAVLGSAATDTLAGLGPAPLEAGDELGVACAASAEIPASDLAPWSPPAAQIEVRVVPGPREDAFTPAARAALFDAVWTVTAAADRVGIRLEGPRLERADTAELPSEGMVPGAIQVPPGGMPTILLADGPVTGGYPVIATATDADLDALGQAAPGTRIRFRHAPVR